MPVYSYKCRDCGTPLEVHQEFSDAALTECPVCGGTLRKQYGSIGVTFNGSGFYRTDSRAASGEGGSKSGSDSGSSGRSDGGSSSTPAKSESKPAAPASTSGS
ncbi:FmdB family zinc ribbon protein [Amnibacterium endophyticum]|uniref:FmdB family zinc ribbon protein n=1 Tax=Amnibacterium endophyticum TaxID=2109337 RepID=A0ABW4LF91_9MICO